MSTVNHDTDEITTDLRKSTITTADNIHVTDDLRKPIRASTANKHESTIVTDPSSNASTSTTSGHAQHDCPGHYVLNGGISLISDDMNIFSSKSKEIKEILDSIIPSIVEKLTAMKIGMRIQFSDKIGVFKCVPPPSESKDVPTVTNK